MAFGQNFPIPPSIPPANPAAGPGGAGKLSLGGAELGLPGAEEVLPGPSGGDRSLLSPGDHSSLESAVAPNPMNFEGDFNGFRGGRVFGDPACDDGCRPALTESTGTWLRRGWWYTEIDAVVLNRIWKRDDTPIAFDTSSNRVLRLNGSDPGASGSARLTLGRFLFRDQRNRDHTVEFTAFGGGEWSQDDSLTSGGGGNTLSVPIPLAGGNPGFNQATSMSVDYSSRFSSFEVNYLVKERMRRDRMELSPHGEWVRRANKGFTKQYLIGLRYFDLADILEWRAENITTQGGEDGLYRTETNNDLFGLHLGGAMLYERDRWSIEVGGKGGVFINDAKADSLFTITNNAANSFRVDNRETAFSFLGEFKAIGRYHLRPNLSLRAGWQMMYLTGVALAPDQINFSPDEGRFPYTGDPFYHGALFGFEGYW